MYIFCWNDKCSQENLEGGYLVLFLIFWKDLKPFLKVQLLISWVERMTVLSPGFSFYKQFPLSTQGSIFLILLSVFCT